MTEIEWIEVLRGPQGTLFGRDTTGGVVKRAVEMAFDISGFASASFNRPRTYGIDATLEF